MFKVIKTGNLKGNYVGIRIKPPYELETVYDLGSRIGEILNSSNILIRTVESENEVPLICIDLITPKRYENYKQKVEQLLIDKKLTLGKYTFMKLE